MPRSRECSGKLIGKGDGRQRHVLVDRGIAEQNVEKLAAVVPHRFGFQRDNGLEHTAAAILDRQHLADDFAEHARVVNGRHRHFHALLDRNGASAGLDRRGIRSDKVMDQ